MAVRALTLKGIMLLVIPVTLTVPIALLYAGYSTLVESLSVGLYFLSGLFVSTFIFGVGIPMTLLTNDAGERDVQTIVKAIILSGIATIAVVLAICLAIGFLFRLMM